MRIYLKNNEIDFVIESLNYTIFAFENYKDYPDYKFQKGRIAEAKEVRQTFIDARNKYNEIKKGRKK